MTPYYESDGITIYNADCADLLPLIDPATVDLVLTDPPYGINLDTDFTWRMSVGDEPGTFKNKWNKVDGDDAAFDPVLLLAFPRVLIWGGNFFVDRLPLGKWLIWNKRDVGKQNKGNAGEMAWHNLGGASVDVFNHYWQGRFRMGEIGSFLHPAQKPVALMRWILDKWTEPADLILDPYMGSGPIAQACFEMGRRYIGIEIVEEYCRITVERRLVQATLDLVL